MSSSQHRNSSPQPERLHRWQSQYELEQHRLFYLQARNLNNPASSSQLAFRNPGGRRATAIWHDPSGPVTRTLQTLPSAFGITHGTDVVITLLQDQRREYVKTLPERHSRKKKKRRLQTTISQSDDAGWNPIPNDVVDDQQEDGEEDEDDSGALSILMGAASGGDDESFAGTGKRKRYASSVRNSFYGSLQRSDSILGRPHVKISSRITGNFTGDTATGRLTWYARKAMLRCMWTRHGFATRRRLSNRCFVSVRHLRGVHRMQDLLSRQTSSYPSAHHQGISFVMSLDCSVVSHSF